jgi:Tfp pilus assembly protein PilX
MNIKRQAGFGAVVVLIALVALTVIGFAGFKVYSTAHSAEAQTNDGKTTQPAESSAATTAKAPEITSAADLDKASAALDSIDADNDDGDTSQLNTQLNGL